MSHDLRQADPITQDHETTEMAALAARFINSTARHVFLTGKAGTGKTTFLHELARSTHKRFVILAPTGIAALNARGVTIHSQFLLPFGSFVPERRLPADIPEYGRFHDRDSLNRRHPLNAIRRQVLRAVDLLIIDEVSMLRADLLDAIDHRMRSVRGVYDRSFGGAQVLLIGDLFQLPPVVKDEEWQVLRRWYASPHFFDSRVIREAGYAHIELDKIFRQQDEAFIHLLNNLRNNTVTPADVETLNAHYRANIPQADREGVITLTTHNRTADELNQEALRKLKGEPLHFEAKVEGEFPPSMYPVLQDLELKVGAQIMFIRNDPEKVYFNGKLARVTALEEDRVDVEMVDDGLPYTLKTETWENKRYTVDPVTKEQQEEVIGTFEQYPIKLAWAITVHKSQGLTFDKAIIDVGKAFAPGQVYVALSRLRSLDGLILRTRIDPSVVSTDRDVMAFSEARHTQVPLDQQLETEQRQYLQAVLSGSFDLGDLQRKVSAVQSEHSEVGEFEEESMRTALSLFAERIMQEGENARRFRQQLQRLLQAGEREQLMDRLEKGCAYFAALLKEGMKDLLRHLAQVEQLSRTKAYADDLREIDGLLVQQLALIGKAVHITTCILNGLPVTKRNDLERTLSEQRTALVAEIGAWLKDNAPKVTTRSGRKRASKATDGVFVKKAAKKSGRKKVKGETYLKSYALLAEGKDVATIAKERGLTRGTVEGHMARGITEGKVAIDQVMDVAAREAIAAWMRANADQGTTEARAHFGEAYSFGQLRIVQAWLKAGSEEAGSTP